MGEPRPSDHTHLWHVEQQTNHRFCLACGKHDPPDPRCADRESALWRFLTDRSLGPTSRDA